MSKELDDAEYAAMLAGGNVTVAWHSIDPKKFKYETVNAAMTEAVYRAVCQVFKDRLNITLPVKMPDLFADDGAASQSGESHGS